MSQIDNIVVSNNITVLNARAEFLDDRTVKLTDPDGGEQTLTAERIFINTGATPRRLGVARRQRSLANRRQAGRNGVFTATNCGRPGSGKR